MASDRNKLMLYCPHLNTTNDNSSWIPSPVVKGYRKCQQVQWILMAKVTHTHTHTSTTTVHNALENTVNKLGIARLQSICSIDMKRVWHDESYCGLLSVLSAVVVVVVVVLAFLRWTLWVTQYVHPHPYMYKYSTVHRVRRPRHVGSRTPSSGDFISLSWEWGLLYQEFAMAENNLHTTRHNTFDCCLSVLA